LSSVILTHFSCNSYKYENLFKVSFPKAPFEGPPPSDRYQKTLFSVRLV
jgi:hypothetical protein